MRYRARIGMVLVSCGLAASAALGTETRVTFEGHKVVRAEVATQAELDALLDLSGDIWSHRVGLGTVDARVTPSQFLTLQQSGLRYEVLIDDVQALIDAERSFAPRTASFFDDYHPYTEVVGFLNQLASDYPALAATFSIGTTVEGRLMWAIHITGPPGIGEKPAILYNGGQHAREWITVPAICFLADHLLQNYGTDPYVTDLVDRIDWYLLPVMNPDGYVYSWDVNRMWRKNRRNNGDGTYGVDLNRNWGFHWGGAGSSPDTVSQTYRGPSPFSEPESNAVRAFFLARPNIRAYFDIHSYSQMILWPWGYTPAFAPDQEEYDYVGAWMQQSIQSIHGRYYTRGPINTTIYPVSGGSNDWTYGIREALSFSFELRDTGQYGFLLPASQIVPNCEEILPSLLFLADWASPRLDFVFPDPLPTETRPALATTIPVNILPVSEYVVPGTEELRYRFGSSGPFTPVALQSLGGDLYESTIPAPGCESLVEFYFRVQGDLGGEAVSPTGAPDRLYSLNVDLNVAITQQPADVAVCLGDPVAFTVVADGYGTLSYQWRLDGADIPGATNPTYSIASVTPADLGDYTVAISDACGGPVVSQAATLAEPDISFTQHPPSLIKCVGEPVVLTASVASLVEPSYQWEKDGVPIPGATSDTLWFPSAEMDDAGEYRLVATVACVSVSSDSALLTVNLSPEFTLHPLAQCVPTGGTATFTVQATGGTVYYQWLKDLFEIPGENQPTLTLTSVTAGDAGLYSAFAYNDTGCLVFSEQVPLGVDACPSCDGPPGDAVGDCRVDLLDFAVLQGCYTGSDNPGYPPAYSTGCDCLDVDADGDIDAADVDAFAGAISGPGTVITGYPPACP